MDEAKATLAEGRRLNPAITVKWMKEHTPNLRPCSTDQEYGLGADRPHRIYTGAVLRFDQYEGAPSGAVQIKRGQGTYDPPARFYFAFLQRWGDGNERFDLSRGLGRRDHVHSLIPRTSLMAPMIISEKAADHSINPGSPVPGPTYLHWSPIVAGAIVAAGVSFVLISFGSGIGLAVSSPSSTWRDTSAALAVVGGLWLLLTSLASFGLGGYLAGRLRESWSDATPDAVEFRDGVHGLLVWGLAILIGAFLALSVTKTVAGRADLTAPTAATAESLLAFELDQLFRSDRTPAEPGNDPELRAQAARIITTGVGHAGMAQEDRAYLVRLVQARTGLPQPDAEHRVDQVIGKANDAIARARHGAVILAFMIACSLALGMAVAWLAAASGGQHRDSAVAHGFWRRWEVDRAFIIR